MIIFIDTNLVLDVMLGNTDFYEESDYKDSAVRVMSPADFLSFAKKS